MKNLSILFYLEPWTEKGKPWFRHFPIRSVFNRLAQSVLDDGGKTTLVCGEGSYFTILEHGWGFDCFSEVIVIKEQDLRTISVNANAFTQMDQESPERLAQKMEGIIPGLDGRKFDIAFSWESQCNYLRHLGISKLVQLSPGMLSRTPYPYHLTVDQHGLFAQSMLANKAAIKAQTEKLRKRGKYPIDLLTEASFAELRRRAAMQLPLTVRSRMAQFKKTYCVPLQVSDYFASTNTVSGNNQWDFLLTVLNSVPKDVGIVVTHYVSPGLEDIVIRDENINFLESNFPNLIYSPQLNTVASVSQLLLQSVDGVITISSSVGLQAKMFGKELIAVGDSHLTLVADGSLKDVSTKIKPVDLNTIALLKSLHGSYFLPTDLIFKNQKSISKFIRNVASTNDHFFEYFSTAELNSYYSEQALRAENDVISELPKLDPLNWAQTIINRIANPAIKVVSFDIFDTIVQRELFAPQAVFDIVERKAEASEHAEAFRTLLRRTGHVHYRSLRMETERSARAQLQSLGYEDCNYDEIFDYLTRSTESTSLVKFLKDVELEVEYDVIVPREHGKLLYELARNCGKDVIFTSDMYLPESIIRSFLEKCGTYNGEKIYVSSEIRLRKHSGKLFLHIMKDLLVKPEDILHIGDAEHGDYTIPKGFGITASLVPAARELWRRSYGTSYRKGGAENLTEEVIFGGQAMEVYDFPYYLTDTPNLFRGRADHFGYTVAGPLLVGLSQWLKAAVAEQKLDRLFFFARDGFVVKRVFHASYPDTCKVKTDYVHVSRRVLAIAALTDHDDIIELTKQRFMPKQLWQFIRIRFGLDLWALTNDEVEALLEDTGLTSIEDIVSTGSNLPALLKVSSRLQEKIFAHATELRGKVKSYFSEIGFVPNDKEKIGIFDIGYSASLQRYIEKIYQTNFIKGFYFATFVGIQSLYDQGGQAKGYAGESIDPRLTKYQYVHAVHIFETIFSHTEGSTFNYLESDGGIKPVVTAEQSLTAKNDFVTQLWNGIERFIRTVEKYKDYIDWTQFSWEKSLKPFDDFATAPNPIDVYMLADVRFENVYCGEFPAPIVSFGNSDRKELWSHGQHSANRLRSEYPKAIENLHLAKNFKQLKEYITMIYESRLIRNLIEQHKEELGKVRMELKTLESENEGLNVALQRLSKPKGGMENPHAAPILVTDEELLSDMERWFDEELYIKANPDVAEAIKSGLIESGLLHFKRHGINEGRKLVP